ncbi:MAG: hypothetical protein ABI294_05870 [Casimicrobiaceae bacterium]
MKRAQCRNDGCNTRARGRLAPHLLFALTAFAGSATTAAGADVGLDAGASIVHDSNVGRSLASEGTQADTSVAGFGAAHVYFAPTSADGVTLSLGAGGVRFERYHGLDNGWISAGAAYRRKFGLGYEAPWVRAEALAEYHGYDVDLRSGPRLTSRVEFGKRFGERMSAQAGAYYEQRWSSHGTPAYPGVADDVYDLRGRGMYAGASVAFGDVFTLGAHAGLRRGDVASTASEWSPLLSAASAISEDPTFGNERYVYRLRGTTRNADVTLSYALGDRASINLSISGARTGVAQGYAYSSRATSIAWLYRY